jgi:hypothetical protein
MNTDILRTEKDKDKDKEKEKEKELNNYDGLYFITKLIKLNNKNVLNKIADDLEMDFLKKENFIKKYLKPSFFTPDISNLINEKAQDLYINKKKNK